MGSKRSKQIVKLFNMKQNHYARKKRQLANLVSKLNELLKKQDMSLKAQIEMLMNKIKHLVNELKGAVSGKQLRTILGSLAFIFGLSFTNTTSAQQFNSPVANPFGLTDAGVYSFIDAADLDGDGDLDMLNGSYYGVFYYYENTGDVNNPQFASAQQNPFGLDSANLIASPDLVDIDNDGDLDLFVGEYYGNIKYYENTGSATNPVFANPVNAPFGINTAPSYFSLIEFADIDNDGDYDLLTSEYYGSIKFHENIGSASSPSFNSPQTNPFGISAHMYSVNIAIADFDLDGDLDIMTGSYDYGPNYEGALLYHENTGSATNPQFGSYVANPFGLSSIYYMALPEAADFDGDGDYDLMVGQYTYNYGSYQHSSFMYFENTDLNLSIDNNQEIDLQLYPNPTTNVLNIETELNIEKVEIFDMQGKMVQKLNPESKTIDVSDFKSGLYYLILYSEDNVIRKKFEVVN